MGSDTRQATRLILVVEDEVFIAMELEGVLVEAGYQVLGPAPTVSIALSLLDGHNPDAAVLDVNLGGERVTPVAQALAARGVPFLIASAYWPKDLANEPLLSTALNLGKPTASVRLLGELRRMLSQ